MSVMQLDPSSSSGSTTAPGPDPDDAGHGGTAGDGGAARGGGTWRALQHRDFRKLWLAQLTSELGDYAVHLTFALLTYQRTHNAALSAAVFASTWLPYSISPLLTSWSWRIPARRLLVGADVARAVLVGLCLLPIPLPVLLTLVVAASILSPPFEATRAGVAPDLLPDDDRDAGVALMQTTNTVAICVGYLLASAMTVFSIRLAIGLDAASFLVSAALIVTIRLPRRQLPERVRVRQAARLLFHGPYPRRPMLLLLTLAAACAIPEALAATFAARQGHPGLVGVFAAATAGLAVLVELKLPLGASTRTLTRGLCWTTLACVPVIALLFTATSVPAVLAGYLLLGLPFALTALAIVLVTRHLPDTARATAMSLGQPLLMGSQGAGAVLGGLVATVSPTLAVVVGFGPAAVLSVALLRTPQ
jgi:predicted MFS family arabinose efflux permease